jgi:hypothetical protein
MATPPGSGPAPLPQEAALGPRQTGVGTFLLWEITKSIGGVQALQEAAPARRRGAVHAPAGMNGGAVCGGET